MAGVSPYRDMDERLFFMSAAVDGGFTTECWAWLGALSADGYPRMNYMECGRRKAGWAHRVSFVTLTGKAIPQGFELDHHCQNPWCIAPNHLEAVPLVKNRRMVHVRKRKEIAKQSKELEYEN